MHQSPQGLLLENVLFDLVPVSVSPAAAMRRALCHVRLGVQLGTDETNVSGAETGSRFAMPSLLVPCPVTVCHRCIGHAARVEVPSVGHAENWVFLPSSVCRASRSRSWSWLPCQTSTFRPLYTAVCPACQVDHVSWVTRYLHTECCLTQVLCWCMVWCTVYHMGMSSASDKAER